MLGTLSWNATRRDATGRGQRHARILAHALVSIGVCYNIRLCVSVRGKLSVDSLAWVTNSWWLAPLSWLLAVPSHERRYLRPPISCDWLRKYNQIVKNVKKYDPRYVSEATRFWILESLPGRWWSFTGIFKVNLIGIVSLHINLLPLTLRWYYLCWG